MGWANASCFFDFLYRLLKQTAMDSTTQRLLLNQTAMDTTTQCLLLKQMATDTTMINHLFFASALFDQIHQKVYICAIVCANLCK